MRQARRSDIPGIQRVRHAVRENRLTSTVITDADVADAIERTGRGWIIDVDDAVVGFAIGNAGNGNVWALFVDPEFEGLGFGRRLHDECIRWLFEASGPERLWLTTEPDTRAHRFYLQSGWREIERCANGEVMLELRTKEPL
ncbi:MAG TPA: GNAT family N-acetyltransferase [Steroidobacteraceae bacterium]|nr:GNAT family N-acetyltransferase [Steroidobacteraceae bacterium]